MTVTSAGAATGRLGDAVAATHDHIKAALAAPHHRFDVVVWSSAHLAAMSCAMHPLLRANLPAEAYDRLTASDTELRKRLRLLERVLSGDASTAVSSQLAAAMVAAALRCYAEAETRTLAAADAAAPVDATRHAAAAYLAALNRGPTRPHPHLPRTGPFARPALAAARLRDRVLDVLDSRHIPLPRASEALPVEPDDWATDDCMDGP